MNTMCLSIDHDKDGAQIVRRPRSTDAIGHALRGAFGEGCGLPDEMVVMLRRLDQTPAKLN